jgi:hypothetical protein
MARNKLLPNVPTLFLGEGRVLSELLPVGDAAIKARQFLKEHPRGDVVIVVAPGHVAHDDTGRKFLVEADGKTAVEVLAREDGPGRIIAVEVSDVWDVNQLVAGGEWYTYTRLLIHDITMSGVHPAYEHTHAPTAHSSSNSLPRSSD